MGTAILGRIGFAIESSANPGEQLIYSGTIASLPASATTQPNAIGSIYAGSRLLIIVSGNSTTGTVSIAGKDFSQAQNAITETTPTIAIAGSASNPTSFGAEYTTTNVFSTINASGITASGLTGGTLKIYAIAGAHGPLAPAMLEAEEKIAPFSPVEQRGLVSLNTNIQRLNKVVDVGKFSMVLYPDTSVWWFTRCCVGSSPTQTFLPASASTLTIRASTAVSGFPVSATTQPNVLGPYAQLQFVVSGSSATGSFTVAGVNSAGVSVTETITCSGTNGNGTYTSVNSFQTINASGIGGSLSGLTSGSVVTNGLYPTQLLAVTAVSSLPASLSTQPNTLGAAGSLLQITASGSSAVGSIKITGTNVYGQTITETVLCGVPGAANGNGTFYTQQAFVTVASNGVTLVSGLTSGSIAINGIIALQEVSNAAPGNDVLSTLAVEWYTGTDALTHPFTFFTEVSISGEPNKEIRVEAKAGAQDQLAIGNRATTPLTASTATTQIGSPGAFSATGASSPAGIWQPFDIGLSGWQGTWFVDALSGTAGTTGYPNVLTWKITFKIPQEPVYTTVASQRMQRLYRKQRSTELEITIDFIDEVQYENFRQNIKQLWQLQLVGPPLGVIGSTAYNKLWQLTMPVKILEFKRDASKMDKVEATIKGTCEYTLNVAGSGVNFEYQLTTISQTPPNYAS